MPYEEGEEDSHDQYVESEVVPQTSAPTETFLEVLSRKMGIHPMSVYWRIREGIEREGWRCLPEERRLTADRFTIIILHLLGHRWPKQIETDEPIPNWADPDGIIPLTEGTGEPTLYDRLRDRIATEFPGGNVTAIEAEFAEIMGKPLAQWLTHDFFKHHTSQFKKRPIAWQIGSGKFTARRRPAFACLVYYHKLDGSTLAAIQSQYVRPLRGRYETGAGWGIEANPGAGAASASLAAASSRKAGSLSWRDFDDRLGGLPRKASCQRCPGEADRAGSRWITGARLTGSSRSADREALERQETAYIPDLNDGVRVNIAPLQKAGLLAADVIAGKDVEKAIADRAEWRADERRWCREGKLPRPGWWK
ncbi:hypothetical protein [Candidatus Amarolinea dominans]|uniref:hypothetical protein n=1 Tax=Candidatus Amarolinea dominans TaxID=3140696 RepID=UPI0031349706|nr:hypothetical protein [Anaerolineae bacterium]